MTQIYASAVTEIKAQFYDLDPMNVVWHGNYARFFEQSRCELLDQIDYNYGAMHQSGFAWPVVDMHIRYIAPVEFGQVIVILAELIEYEFRLKIRYSITDKITGKRICKGHTEQVAVDQKTGKMQFASPPVLAQKLGVSS